MEKHMWLPNLLLSVEAQPWCSSAVVQASGPGKWERQVSPHLTHKDHSQWHLPFPRLTKGQAPTSLSSLFLVTTMWLTLVTPSTEAYQVPLSMGLPRQEYWSWQYSWQKWVAISSSRGSSWPRGQTRVSWLAGGFFPAEPPGWALWRHYLTWSS